MPAQLTIRQAPIDDAVLAGDDLVEHGPAIADLDGTEPAIGTITVTFMTEPVQVSRRIHRVDDRRTNRGRDGHIFVPALGDLPRSLHRQLGGRRSERAPMLAPGELAIGGLPIELGASADGSRDIDDSRIAPVGEVDVDAGTAPGAGDARPAGRLQLLDH